MAGGGALVDAAAVVASEGGVEGRGASHDGRVPMAERPGGAKSLVDAVNRGVRGGGSGSGVLGAIGF